MRKSYTMRLMYMKGLLFLILFVATVPFSFCQKAEIIYKNDSYQMQRKGRSFVLINKRLDISNKVLVAKLKGVSLNTGKSNLQKVYNSFYYNANQLGANSFVIDTIIGAHTDTISIQISVYNLSKDENKLNMSLFTNNSIFLVGGLKKSMEGKSFKLNNEKAILPAMVYQEYPLDIDEKLKISIGGILGASVTFTGYEGRTPTFISLHGLTVAPGYSSGVGISFNTGRIYPVDMSFGYMLIAALRKSE